VLASSDDPGTATSIRVPQGEHFDLVALFVNAVVDVVSNPGQEQASHAGEAFTSSSCADVWLESE
jgi:hypothetical protein